MNNIELYEEKIPTKYFKPSEVTTLHSNFSSQLDESESVVTSTINVSLQLFAFLYIFIKTLFSSQRNIVKTKKVKTITYKTYYYESFSNNS